MPELNEWTLAYDGAEVTFGTHESGYPFTSQVVIGPAVLEAGDQPHPLGDGWVPGIDVLRGRSIEFNGALITQAPDTTGDRWAEPLELNDTLEAMWPPEELRETLGAVATLTHDDGSRVRTVYGRPRDYSTDLAKLRQGWATWAGRFVTVDHRFYGEEVTQLLNAAVTGDPASPAPQATVANAGTLRAFPVVTFAGTVTDPMVHAYAADNTHLWSVGVTGSLVDELGPGPGGLGYGVLDARPWTPGLVNADGDPYPGKIRGGPLRKARFPVGTFKLAFSCTAKTGAPTATVKWRPPFASM